ncbi:MAG: hypothetical protein Q7K54_03605 [Candidatus Parcubacteria bacterium]|nr:hypothetical protein [Candidatus Parcubacteria bacterium]
MVNLVKGFTKYYDDIEKKQVQKGLAKTFRLFKANGVAKEIEAGRNVVKNTEYGYYHSIYGGPRVNTSTGAFYPVSIKRQDLNKQMFDSLNKVLISGGYTKLPYNLITRLKRKDRVFETRMRKQFGNKFHIVIE